ncbi:Disabled-like protein 2-interacting protein [Armadillidium vulgare]|nr:Disabled-like protein 2-interacting protein [Armadillidium vulgare]
MKNFKYGKNIQNFKYSEFQKVTILPLVEYKRFTKYLKEGSLTLCRKLESLLNAKAKEDFVTSLISVLQYNKKAVSFLNQLIISDVKQSGDNDKVLFRANSMATKAIEVYMRLVGERILGDHSSGTSQPNNKIREGLRG